MLQDAERHELQRQIDIHQCQNFAEVATSKKGIQKFKKINDRKDPFYKYGYAVQAYLSIFLPDQKAHLPQKSLGSNFISLSRGN